MTAPLNPTTYLRTGTSSETCIATDGRGTGDRLVPGDRVVDVLRSGTRNERRAAAYRSRRERSENLAALDRVDRSSDLERTDGRTEAPPDGGSTREPSGPDPLVHWGVLVAPLLVTVAYGLPAALYGVGVFDTGTRGAGRLLAFGLLGTLLLVAAWSTARLYDDARWIAAGSTEWAPNPWLYIVGGAVAILCLRAYQLLVLGYVVEQPGIYLAGNFVVALALSSIVGGPAYALRRRRHLHVA